MSTTDEIRAELTRLGVDWANRDSFNDYKTVWHHDHTSYLFIESIFYSDMAILKVRKPTPEQAIAATLGPKVTGNTSDGYHTFNELYHHRAVLFSVIVRDHRELAWKSMRHHDGTMYDGMFIVGIETPEGQATYHYDIDPYWDMFNCKELDQAPEWDGHTPSEAIERIATLGSCNCPNNCTNSERTETCEADETDTWECVRDDLGGYGKMLTVHVMECTECGHVYEHVNGDYEYCPRCGRKRRDVEE